jgi:hypothetical protein
MTNINVTQKYLLVFKNSEIIVWGGGERGRERRERERERERE